jgi:hypothetical protein
MRTASPVKNSTAIIIRLPQSIRDERPVLAPSGRWASAFKPGPPPPTSLGLPGTAKPTPNNCRMSNVRRLNGGSTNHHRLHRYKDVPVQDPLVIGLIFMITRQYVTRGHRLHHSQTPGWRDWKRGFCPDVDDPDAFGRTGHRTSRSTNSPL